jgi:hypothetical protein
LVDTGIPIASKSLALHYYCYISFRGRLEVSRLFR